MPLQALAAGTRGHSVEVVAETQDFEDGYGKLNTATLEYKFESEHTTVVVSPRAGERKGGGRSQGAVGFGASLYQDLNDGITSRTSVAIAEDEPVFPRYDLSQDVTLRLMPKTTGTLGVRWARYFGDRDVHFANAGVRYYFKGGSVAYRLTYVDPEGRDGFLAHLVNLSVNDARGEGTTGLWLGTGASSFEAAPLDERFSGDDYGAFLERTQPIGGNMALILGAGYNSYDRPGDRIGAWKFALGLRYQTGR